MGKKSRKLSHKVFEGIDDIDKILNNANKEYKDNEVLDVLQYGNVTYPISKVEITDHAYKRASERFNFKEEKVAKAQIKGLLKKSKLIGMQLSENGTPSVLFAYKRHGFYLSRDLKTVLTVNRFESVTYEPLKNKIAELHAKEIRKLERKESCKSKRLKLIELECQVELAELKLRYHKSRSESVKLSCQCRIKAINERLQELKEEINELQSAKRQVTRSMASVV